MAILEVEHISKSFDDTEVLKDIRRQEVLFMAKNKIQKNKLDCFLKYYQRFDSYECANCKDMKECMEKSKKNNKGGKCHEV